MSIVEKSHYVVTTEFLINLSVADPLVELDELKWSRKTMNPYFFVVETITLRRVFKSSSSSEARVPL